MPSNRTIVPASHLQTEIAPHFEDFRLKLLAQGDSWFSINGVSPFTAASLLTELNFSDATLVVNCADPADTLQHMVDWRRDPFFFRYFGAGERFEIEWGALLLSGGGNDLIDALAVRPADANGVPRTPRERLLLTKDERPAGGAVSRYLSPEGWALFRDHMLLQFEALDAMRANSAKNRNTPIVAHCYNYMQPRNVGAGPLGPWLLPTVVAYEVPPDDWLDLSKHVLDRLHDDVLTRTGLANFHLLDSRTLIPPAPAAADEDDPNWLNEIHPTARGYDLIAPGFVGLVEAMANFT